MAKTQSFDQLTDKVAKMCNGFASIVRCRLCEQIVAIIFRDFQEEGDENTFVNWSGCADEHEVTCEKCI
jgi:hypothetical protein